MTESQPKLSTPWTLSPVPGSVGDDASARWTGDTVPTPWPAAYGGDLCVGALRAVYASAAADQVVHALQVAFLRPGDREAAVSYDVERVRDGFRYANRALRINQAGTEIAVATASLRTPRSSEESMPALPPHAVAGGADPTAVAAVAVYRLPAPETLPTAAVAIAQRQAPPEPDAVSIALEQYWAADRALDTRHIDPPLYGNAVQPRTWNRIWVRFTPTTAPQHEMLASPAGRSALIAYLADDTILEPAIAALGHGWLTPGLFSTTVQQNVWFHSDFDAAEWLLFSQRLVSRSGDHVVCSGEISTAAGVLVATVLQEGIVRLRHR